MNRLNVKPNPQMTTDLETELVNFRRTHRDIETILTLQGHPGWERFVENAQEQLKLIERDLDNFEHNKMSDRDIVLKLKERKDLRWLMNVIENAKSNLPGLEQRIRDLDKRLAERKARNGKQGQF